MTTKVFAVDAAHAALAPADVVARGAEPKLIVDADHSLILANPWLWKRAVTGAVGQVEVLEEEVESAIAFLAFADEPYTSVGDEICIMTNAWRVGAVDRIWSRAVVDGLDISAPFLNKGSAYAAFSDFAEGLIRGGGVIHVDYFIKPADWYELQQQTSGTLSAHFQLSMNVADCVDNSGWFQKGALAWAFTSGRSLVAERNAGTGSVRPVLEAVLAQAQSTGVTMFGGAGAASAAKAATVLDWLVESRQDPLLGPFLVARGGSPRRRLEAELELRATLHSGPVVSVRHALVSARASWLPELPELAVLFEPIPGVQDTMRLLDSMMSLAGPHEAAQGGEFSKFSDVRALNDRLKAVGFAVVVQEEARRRAALVPPGTFGAVERVGYGLDEFRAGRTAVSAAPRLVSASAVGAGEDASPQVLDQTQTSAFCAALRTVDARVFLQRLEELSAGVTATGAAGVGFVDPHRILAHLLSSKIKGVRRFAVGLTRSLPHAAFSHPAVSGVHAHVGTYLAEAVLTEAGGTVLTQLGKRLVLPAAMLKAARLHAWASVDWEELVLLCKGALEPVVFSQRISPGEAWTSVLRADDLLTFGSRLVAAAGGGLISDSNSFGTVLSYWKVFLAKGDVLGGSVRSDHVANARAFMRDCLALADVHGRAAMADSDPLGALEASFVPAGAAPFLDLDKHNAARVQVVGLSSSLPSLAVALGLTGGVLPPGVVASGKAVVPAAPTAPLVGGTVVAGAKGGVQAASKATLLQVKHATANACSVKDGNISYGNGRAVPIAELAAAAGVPVDALCWPCVAARGRATARFVHCPHAGKPGHETNASQLHVRPALLSSEKLLALFGWQQHHA